jgi:uncharacterized protein (DUF433 family)
MSPPAATLTVPEDTATPYDPAAETDLLIRRHITRDPVTGDAVFVSVDYPVWAVLLNLQGATDGGADVLRLFPGLTADDLRAAARFWARYSQEIAPYLE